MVIDKVTHQHEALREIALGVFRELFAVGQPCRGVLCNGKVKLEVRRVKLMLGDVQQGTLDACPVCRYEYDRLGYQVEPLG